MDITTNKRVLDYELIDCGEGEKLERFGKYVLARPDPEAIWEMSKPEDWTRADAVFNEKWQKIKTIPDSWQMDWEGIKFYAKLTPFKHVGVFPEQMGQWDWLKKTVKNDDRVLNLFAYTGIASLVAARAGAVVTHVDSSRPTISWARENQAVSKLSDRPIRWILDDVMKFVAREERRKSEYDGIIMDPPVYGHGPAEEVWDFGKDLPKLLALCRKILSKKPKFILINAYAVSMSAITLGNVLEDFHFSGGKIETGELFLTDQSGRKLSTGIWGKWFSS